VTLPGALRSRGVHVALRLVLGVIFVVAALPKIADPAAFARIVYQWQVVPPVPANLVAIVLPWVELVAGLLLISGVWKKDAALVVALLLVVFLGAASYVLAQGIDVENCGCTSVSETHGADAAWPPPWTRGVGWFLVTRNVLLLGAALVVAFREPGDGPAVAPPAATSS